MSKALSEGDIEIEKIRRLKRRIAGLSEKAEKMFIMGKGEDTFSSLANGIMPFLQLLPEFSDKIKQMVSEKTVTKALKKKAE